MSYFKWISQFSLFLLAILSSPARADYSPVYTCPGPYACIFSSYLGLKFPDGTTQTTAASGGSSYTFSLPLLNTAGTVSLPASTSSVNGYLSSTDWATFNAKQASGSYITALTSDVSASGPGSAVSTVNSVGGSSAANLHSAELAANAATSTNTFNTLVQRDGTGSFLAGSPTFTGLSLTGFSGVLKASAGSVSGSATTTDLTEGSNLYYTSARVQTVGKTNVSAQLLYVSKDVGNDSTGDGSLLKPYQTIGAGITAANALASYYKQVIVTVEPSNGSSGYNENISLTQQGVNLECVNPFPNSRPCVVSGTLSVNLTGTSGGVNFIAASNEVYVQGMTFASGSSNTVTFSGSTFQRLILVNCYIQAGAAMAVNETNTGINGVISELRSYDTTFENNSASIPTVTLSGGRFWLYGTTPTIQNDNTSGPSFSQIPAASITGNLTSGSACIASPSSLTGIAVGQKISDTTSAINSLNIAPNVTVAALPGSCSAGQIQMSSTALGTETTANLNLGGSSMIANLTQFVGQYQLSDNTATATFNLATIASGTASCISTPSLPNTNGTTLGGYTLLSYFGCNSTNTNSLTGSGIAVSSPGNARVGSSGDLVSTITQAVLPGLPQGEVMIGAGATTGTNVNLSIKDGHVKIAQTTAPTTTLSGNAGTGGTPACTITNGTDSDGKLSLKTGTASWATGTQCTINFNKAWSVAPICIFSPSNDAASTAMASQRIVMLDASTSAQTISAGVAFASQVTATFHYHCEESQ